jgi:hypothetical protein
MPSDDTNVPDFLVKEGNFIPSVIALYGIRCEGNYSHFFRFDPHPAGNTYPFSQLLGAAFDIAGTSSIAMALVGDSAGLVGASLLRSPDLEKPPRGIFKHPDIRHWLSYTAEPAYAHTLTVIAGIATTEAGTPYLDFLRPYTVDGKSIHAHFHAMPCNMQPLGSGLIDLNDIVSNTIRHSPPLDVLHLMNDSRQAIGSGESEFFRGACWVAPIQGVSV